jgi:hypothetical protein
VTNKFNDDVKLFEVAGPIVCPIRSAIRCGPTESAIVLERSIPSVRGKSRLSAGRCHDSLADVGIRKFTEDVKPFDTANRDVGAIQLDLLTTSFDPLIVLDEPILLVTENFPVVQIEACEHEPIAGIQSPITVPR